jgi:hypothetical protein
MVLVGIHLRGTLLGRICDWSEIRVLSYALQAGRVPIIQTSLGRYHSDPDATINFMSYRSQKLFHLTVVLGDLLVHKIQLAIDETQARERAMAEDPCWSRAEFAASGPAFNDLGVRAHCYVSEGGNDGHVIWSEPVR